MSIHVALHHLTTYKYDRPIALSPQTIRLRPAPHCRTAIESYALSIRPADHFINWQQDPHGNYQARLVFPERTRSLEIEVELIADMSVINPFDFFLEPEAEHYPFKYDPILEQSLAPFRIFEAPGPLLTKWLASVDRSKRLMNDFLVDLNQRLQQEIGYVVRMEFGVQGLDETLTLKTGSCRDTAWLLVQILRHLGFAARFVSGYLIQLTADQKPIEGAAGTERDFTDLHAWAEVYLPGSGWIGLDPTSGMLTSEGHIPLACTPEPASAAPITGLLEPAEVEFGFEMSVTRIRETPRVTKPYDEAQWARIDALGDRVDRDLVEHDVRLTMGGEPTFVSVDDMEGAEWNIAALGDDKRQRADQLFRRLADRFAPGALLHYGQGKWYPGEPLPRWALSCFWRNDGEPIWRDRGLLADPDAAERGNATVETSGRFAAAMAERLGVDPAFIHPAFEDAWYYLWREKRLPVNVHPHESKLEDPLERVRIARLLDGELGDPIGYVLPLASSESSEGDVEEPGAGAAGKSRRRPTDPSKQPPGWRSAPWYFRDGTLFLVAGDSPMGLRLPLDTLPWQHKADRQFDYPVDPSAPRDELPPRRVLEHVASPQGKIDPASHVMRPPALGESAKGLVRTALCVEVRKGWVHIFMPPLTRVDDYVALIAVIEDAAQTLALKVVIEGYVPDYDPRLESFSVTPDPGVIEVNIHPAKTWRELVERTTTVYEEARTTRLGAEKFMLDGRHTGTGGGNHVVLGGAAPADSPLLRRPDLLRSFLTYWNNHPALSYLFSGTFIGPTSQHPRVDEARNDSLYELEIAFQQIPDKG
ncbi:MAG: transglutaminase family protein, partial [Proteobacteria bacterium]|nr:transglutaminase family protein [Pseudomonadota bacterium]